MFGKRFSISASALAVAGACLAMLSSPVVIAQGLYQQTGFPQYGRPQISGLSAAATQPPTFSDISADASAMSPNSWGQSVISNPYAGYGDTGNTMLPAAMPTRTQDYVPIQPKSISVLAPPSTKTADPLTNTEYSRPEQRPDRYADATFATDQEIPLSGPAATVKIEFPKPKDSTASLDATPFDIPALIESSEEAPSASFEGVITSDSTSEGSGIKRDAPSPLQITQPPTPPTIPTHPPTETQGGSVSNSVVQPQRASTQPFIAQPFIAQRGYPLFTPAQDQPAYVTDTPQTSFADFDQSNSLITPVPGFDYPSLGQMQNQNPLLTRNQGFGVPSYRSNLAFRSESPTARNQTVFDQGELFDHENKKKEFPPFSEIIAQGRFFGSLELAVLRPHFLGNTGISIDGPTFSESIPFEFDNETAPHVRFGFESKYGPGFELNYFTLNANSNAISQPFDGVSSVTTIASVTGPNRFTQLSADAIGETLNANHSFEIETFGFNVFKDIGFKVSRIGGRFGFTYANIAQSLEASVTDGGGNILDSLDNTTDFRGFGPQLGIDYYRPVGHTPLEFVTSFSGLGLFGRRDQFVNNTAGLVERRFGADEFIAMLDLTSGIQYKKTVAENRAWFARLAFVHQTWLGGGTAVDPTGDFGMKGVTFGVGYNR